MKAKILGSFGIVFALGLLITVITFSFPQPENAEAGPTRMTVHSYRYTCLEQGSGITCETGVVVTITAEESFFHKWLGRHPHNFDILISTGPDRVEFAVSCSECSF